MPRVNGYKYNEKRDVWFKIHEEENLATVCGYDELQNGYLPVVTLVDTSGKSVIKGLIPLMKMDVLDAKSFDTVSSKSDAKNVLRSWMKENPTFYD